MPARDPAYYGRVTLTQIARELGVTRGRARKLVTRHAYAAGKHGATYDARFIDFYRATHGLPHRPLEPIQMDWLTRYQEEQCRSQQPGE